MKKVIIALLLSVSFMGFAQTSIEARDPLDTQEYAMELKAPHSTIAISVYKTAAIKEKTFILRTESKIRTSTKGIILKLSSGEVLKFKDAVINCESLSKDTYVLKGSILLTPELYTKMSQSEITEFKLGKTKVPVEYKEQNENLKGLFKFSEQY